MGVVLSGAGIVACTERDSDVCSFGQKEESFSCEMVMGIFFNK